MTARRGVAALVMAAVLVVLTACAGGTAQLRSPLESARSSVNSSTLGLDLYADGKLTWPALTGLLGDMTRDLRDAETSIAASGKGADHAVYREAVEAVRDAADAVASAHATLSQHPDASIGAQKRALSSASTSIDAALHRVGESP
ncbi:hypothetical protein SAMN04489806_0658 [Paramicrobacterium humi]|uniref:Uncharacterized protein n=1 Tax=Paramicrobacterium humi TaxID=640635 RepID=A0A1H4JEZ6_9MICO|nr:hypothetical protein SAMN04489806_0658 [Microbacterium humi]